MSANPFQVACYGLSDIGRARSNNEDVFRALLPQQFFVLADGMGGHNAGEVAAEKAVESLCISIGSAKKPSTTEEGCSLLRRAIKIANETVFTLAQRHKAYSGMGTTLSCFLLQGEMLLYAHVGDSRLYRMRGKLERLTQDHSLRHAMLTSEDKPRPRLYRNVITRAVGTHTYVHPDVGIIPLKRGDIYILCSDGLTDFISEETIAKVLHHFLVHGLEKAAKTLVSLALKAGGSDNITVLIVKIL